MSNIPKWHSGDTAKYFAWLRCRGIHFFKIPNRSQNRSSKLNSTEHVELGNCDNSALIVLGASLSLGSFFSFSSLFFPLFLTMKTPVPRTRTQTATIPLQESLYTLLTTVLSVCRQVPRQQPSRSCGRRMRTAPAEVWLSSSDSVSPKQIFF